MKVILLQDIQGTGKKNQILEISDGYARNYLLPRKLAREATSEAVNALQKSQSAAKHREEVRKADEAVAQKSQFARRAQAAEISQTPQRGYAVPIAPYGTQQSIPQPQYYEPQGQMMRQFPYDEEE